MNQLAMNDVFASINPTKLARLFDASTSIVLVMRERDWVLVDMNAAFEQYTGIARAEALGRRPGNLGLWHDAHDRRLILQRLQDQKRVVGLPLCFHACDQRFGTGQVSAEIFAFGNQSYVLGIIQDVQIFDSNAKASAMQSQNYARFFHESDLGMYRAVPDGEIIEANQKFLDLFGFESLAQLSMATKAHSFSRFAKPEDAAEATELLGKSGPARRVQLKKLNGDVFWASEQTRLSKTKTGELLCVEGTITDTTELENVRSQAAAIEARYQAIVENSQDGVFLLQNGVVNFMNTAACNILDRRAEDIIGTKLIELVHPDDQVFVRERCAARDYSQPGQARRPVRMVRKDGATRTVFIKVSEFELDNMLFTSLTLRDMTEDLDDRNRMQLIEQRYGRLFENASVGIFQTDEAGQILEANPCMVKLFGFANLAQMRAHVPNLLQVVADFDQRAQWLRAVENQINADDVEIRMTHREGHEFWVSMSYRMSIDHDVRTIEGSLQDISARRLTELQMKFQANHDNLTRLPNRARFETILSELLQKLREQRLYTESTHWVLLLDLDGFKVVNDSLGHAAGDELLVLITERLLRQLPQDLTISRYGGDEFAIVTRTVQPAHIATDVAETVLNALSDPFLVRGQQIFASASIGISRMEPNYLDAQHVIRDADTAMYRAKALGKSRYEVFDRGMHQAAQDRLQLETDLRLALERGEFVCYFQPIVDLATSRIIGAEALTRWQHPTRGLLLPGSFLNVAEESGLLVGLDWFMIDHACRQYLRWMEQLGEECPRTVSVNISDRLFASRGFAGSLSDMLRRIGVPPERVQLEITETVFRGDYQETLSVLRELKDAGVRLLVDDFGTGYSSLVSFTEAAFDGLKIDRGFIHDLEDNQRHRALVKTICQFARDLHLGIVAEGVERQTQAEILRDLGCASAQGFRYAPAISAAQFVERIKIQSRNPEQKTS